MSNNNVKALKSSIWYIVANFLTAASAFLTTPFFTRLMSQEQYGMYNNFTSWQSILAILCTFNIGVSLISARYDYEDNLDQYIFSAVGMSAVSDGTIESFFRLVAKLLFAEHAICQSHDGVHIFHESI